MNAKTDFNRGESIFPMTPSRHKALSIDLKRASGEVTSALRQIGSRQRYSELCLLKAAVDAAQQVLASSTASRH